MILEQLGATNSIQEMGMRLAEIRKQNNAKISRVKNFIFLTKFEKKLIFKTFWIRTVVSM